MDISLNNRRILIADDDFNNVQVILTFLEGISDQVLYAPNGKVACSLARSEKPELIIMDWQMPVMDGLEAIRELKSDDDTKDMTIIVATGVMTTAENLKEALDAGAVDFLRKPFNPVEFKARTESALRIKHQHEVIKDMLEQEKKYVEQALEHKKRELTSMAVLDHQKNSMLNEMLEQINKLDRLTNHVYATDIKAIERQLKEQLDLGKSWDGFKIHFEETHDGFFEKLDQEFPGLSLNERKLCAYIKMGMGNFEISQMTGSSDAALRKAINRMKKKLELGPEDEVRKFLFDY